MLNENCLCADFELRGQTWEIWTDCLSPSNRILIDPRKLEAADIDTFDPPLTEDELRSIYDYRKA